MQNKLKQLTPNSWIINYWKEAIINLKTKDININIADFDYTIFSRDEQLEKEKYLANNRGDLWPQSILDNGWINAFLKKYYNNRRFPTNILNKLSKENDLILTAWIHEFQVAKLIACWLDTYNYIITPSWEDKVIALVRYILYTLKFIPTQITVYEDRPEYFVEYRDLLEDILWCKIEIMYVEMDGNDGYKKIVKI